MSIRRYAVSYIILKIEVANVNAKVRLHNAYVRLLQLPIWAFQSKNLTKILYKNTKIQTS